MRTGTYRCALVDIDNTGGQHIDRDGIGEAFLRRIVRDLDRVFDHAEDLRRIGRNGSLCHLNHRQCNGLYVYRGRCRIDLRCNVLGPAAVGLPLGILQGGSGRIGDGGNLGHRFVRVTVFKPVDGHVYRDGARREAVAQRVLIIGGALYLRAVVLDVEALDTGRHRKCGASAGNVILVGRVVNPLAVMVGDLGKDLRIRDVEVHVLYILRALSNLNGIEFEARLRAAGRCRCKGQTAFTDRKLRQCHVLGRAGFGSRIGHSRGDRVIKRIAVVLIRLQQRIQFARIDRLGDLCTGIAVDVDQIYRRSAFCGVRLALLEVLRQGIPDDTVVILIDAVVRTVILRCCRYLDNQIALGRVGFCPGDGSAFACCCSALINRPVCPRRQRLRINRNVRGIRQEGRNIRVVRIEGRGNLVDIHFRLGNNVCGIQAVVELINGQIDIRDVVNVDIVGTAHRRREVVRRAGAFRKIDGPVVQSRQLGHWVIVDGAFKIVRTNVLGRSPIRLNQGVCRFRIAKITEAGNGVAGAGANHKVLCPNRSPGVPILLLLIEHEGRIARLRIADFGRRRRLSVVVLPDIDWRALAVQQWFAPVVDAGRVVPADRDLELCVRVQQVAVRRCFLINEVSRCFALHLDGSGVHTFVIYDAVHAFI